MRSPALVLVLALLPGIGLAGAEAAGPSHAKSVATANPAAADPNLLDEVRLVNHQVLYGTILNDPASDQTLDLNTGSGTLRIPMDQVDKDHIILGLAARRARLDRDTCDELLQFATWCQERNYTDDALKALRRAVAMPSVPISAVGQLARLVDVNGHPEIALPIYRRYQQGGGDDAGLNQRLADLEKILSEHEQKLSELGLPADDPTGGAIVAASEQPKPAAPAPGGLESKGWTPELIQWSLPCTAQVQSVTTDDGPLEVLAVSSPGKSDQPPANGKSAPEKVAVKRPVDLALADQTVIQLKIRNLGKHKVLLALALKTTDQWRFYESKQVQILPGEEFKTQHFDLKDQTWKCQASNWLYNAKIDGLDQIKELQLLIYNGGNPVELEINGMQLVKNSEM